MSTSIKLFSDTYLDSVIQLSGTRAMREVDGVEWAAAAMATEANLATLQEEGFTADQWDGAGANDLFIAIRAESDEALEEAAAAGERAMFAAREPSGGSDTGQRPPRTLREALERQPASNIAIVSVPGDYAALEAHKALTAGLDVLLFSDNVPLTAEIELKERAARLEHLIMGPGAGTALLGGTCLGFANVARTDGAGSGRVAVVAAAGTGAQEAMSLLDRWGVGVSHVIGLGGRDLSEAVGGTMAKLAVRALVADERTEMILLVSKPPNTEVARSVLEGAAGTTVVASLIGLDVSAFEAQFEVPENVTLARTLETGAVATLAALGRTGPDTAVGLRERVTEACADLPAERTLVRGLFSGGTLCYESLVILSEVLGPVYSNTPIDADRGLPAPAHSHLCLDLGEEEYTKGRPHPMIDPETRIELLREQAGDPEVAAIILDVVLGYGAHADPAAELAPVCAEVTTGGGPRVIAYVLGTEQDPQGFDRQRREFEAAGCVVTETAARASLAAAGIALRDPTLAEMTL